MAFLMLCKVTYFAAFAPAVVVALLLRQAFRSLKVAVITGDDSFDPTQDMGRIYGLLTQLYDVAPIDMSSSTEIAYDGDAIIVIGPMTPYSSVLSRMTISMWRLPMRRQERELMI